MAEPITPEMRQQVREALAQATPAPWRAGQDGNLRVYGPDNTSSAGLVAVVSSGRANVRLIAQAPAWLAAYEAALTAAEARRDEAESILARVNAALGSSVTRLIDEGALVGPARAVDVILSLHDRSKRTEQAEARIAELEAALRRVRAILPEPVWNEKRVLVWSLLDVERIDALLSPPSGGTTTGGEAVVITGSGGQMACDCCEQTTPVPSMATEWACQHCGVKYISGKGGER